MASIILLSWTDMLRGCSITVTAGGIQSNTQIVSDLIGVLSPASRGQPPAGFPYSINQK